MGLLISTSTNSFSTSLVVSSVNPYIYFICKDHIVLILILLSEIFVGLERLEVSDCDPAVSDVYFLDLEVAHIVLELSLYLSKVRSWWCNSDPELLIIKREGNFVTIDVLILQKNLIEIVLVLLQVVVPVVSILQVHSGSTLLLFLTVIITFCSVSGPLCREEVEITDVVVVIVVSEVFPYVAYTLWVLLLSHEWDCELAFMILVSSVFIA